MPTRRQTLPGCAIALALHRSAGAQAFPERVLRIINSGGPGSVPDVLTRIVAEALAAELGRPCVVENRPGAGGIPAVTALLGAAADGYTIAVAIISQAVYNACLFRRLPYSP